MGKNTVFLRISRQKRVDIFGTNLFFQTTSQAYQFSFHQYFMRSHIEPGSTVAMISAGISS